MRKKQARRLKRAKEKKGTKKGNADDQNNEDDQTQGLVKEVQLIDLYTPYTIVRAAGKVRSFDFVREESDANHVQVRITSG